MTQNEHYERSMVQCPTDQRNNQHITYEKLKKKRTAHPNHFPLDTALPLVVSNKPAKREVNRVVDCWGTRRTDTHTKAPSIWVWYWLLHEHILFALLWRSFTDLSRSHSLFSMATPSLFNAFLIFKEDAANRFQLNVKNTAATMVEQDYKLNTWQSVCATWDGQTGLVQLWLDGRPSARRYCTDGTLSSNSLIMIGQVVLSINTYCTIYQYMWWRVFFDLLDDTLIASS